MKIPHLTQRVPSLDRDDQISSGLFLTYHLELVIFWKIAIIISTQTLVADDMRKILSNHEDFRNEKPRAISFMEEQGYSAMFLPKFHPKLNLIGVKPKSHCNYTLLSLRKVINPALDFVTLENIVKYHRKVRGLF